MEINYGPENSLERSLDISSIVPRSDHVPEKLKIRHGFFFTYFLHILQNSYIEIGSLYKNQAYG